MRTEASRSREENSNECMLVKISVDTAENGLFKVCYRKTGIQEVNTVHRVTNTVSANIGLQRQLSSGPMHCSQDMMTVAIALENDHFSAGCRRFPASVGNI